MKIQLFGSYVFFAYIILIYTLFISYFLEINPVLRKDLRVPFSSLHEYFTSIKPKKTFLGSQPIWDKISSLVRHIQPQHFLKHSWWSNASKANKYRQLVWIHNGREGNFIILKRIIPLFQNLGYFTSILSNLINIIWYMHNILILNWLIENR